MNRSEYHIVVFPGATSAPRRFRIKRRTVSILLIASLIAVVLEGAFLVQYVIRSGELWELQSLRSEVADHRGRATALSMGMEDIRKQLSTMQEINTRLRIMLGLDPPKPGHLPPGLGQYAGPMPVVGPVHRLRPHIVPVPEPMHSEPPLQVPRQVSAAPSLKASAGKPPFFA